MCRIKDQSIYMYQTLMIFQWLYNCIYNLIWYSINYDLSRYERDDSFLNDTINSYDWSVENL